MHGPWPRVSSSAELAGHQSAYVEFSADPSGDELEHDVHDTMWAEAVDDDAVQDRRPYTHREPQSEVWGRQFGPFMPFLE